MIKINQAVDAARRREAGLADPPGHRPGPRPGAGLHLRRARGRSSRSCGGQSRAGSPTTRASPTRRSRRQMGVFWPCPDTDPDGNPIDHPGTPRLFEPGSWNPVAKGAGPFYFPDGKARFHAIRVRAADRGRGRRLPGDPDHRPGGEHVPVAATRRGGSARWWTSTRSRCWSCTRSWPQKHGIADGDWVTVESPPRQPDGPLPGGDDDPPGHGVRPVPLGRGQERQPGDDRRPGPDLEDPRVQGLRRPHPQGRGPPEYAGRLEPQQ